MGFGGHLRRRLKHVAKAATKVAVPIHSSGAVKSVAHGVEKYGKAVGTIYALGSGGIVGAAAVKKHPDTFGKTSSKVAAGVIPVEKVGLSIGGGLVAGGIGSSIGSGIGNAIAPDGGGGGGGSTGDVTTAGFQLPSASAGGSSTIWIWVTAGVVGVAVVVLVKKRRR